MKRLLVLLMTVLLTLGSLTAVAQEAPDIPDTGEGIMVPHGERCWTAVYRNRHHDFCINVNRADWGVHNGMIEALVDFQVLGGIGAPEDPVWVDIDWLRLKNADNGKVLRQVTNTVYSATDMLHREGQYASTSWYDPCLLADKNVNAIAQVRMRTRWFIGGRWEWSGYTTHTGTVTNERCRILG